MPLLEADGDTLAEAVVPDCTIAGDDVLTGVEEEGGLSGRLMDTLTEAAVAVEV